MFIANYYYIMYKETRVIRNVSCHKGRRRLIIRELNY